MLKYISSCIRRNIDMPKENIDVPSRACGQTGPKRTAEQRERDQNRITHLYALGYPAAKITRMLAEETRAEGYEVNEATVGRDLKAIKERWHRENMDAVLFRRNQQQTQLDIVTVEAYEAYQFSKEKRREKSAHWMEKLGEVRRANGSRDTITITGEQRTIDKEVTPVPDPRFLMIIIDAARRSAGIWGSDTRPEEAGVAGTGTPAPDPKMLPYEAANVLLMSLVGIEPDGQNGRHTGTV